jgi:peroxiredoxin Q/BCP
VVIVGVSPDTIQSHKKFQEKYDLPFTLLADPERLLIDHFQVWGEKSFMGKKYTGVFRTTFLISPEGKVEQVFENVRPDTHSGLVLASLSLLEDFNG